jgi:L-fucose isomerase-like protein
MRFALFFGNRGFMPAELIEGAREDMKKAVSDAGYEYLIMDKEATRYGAVETREEGRIYARWLKSHEGEYDGVILCQPIFVDENGAVTALRDAGVPILMQAYPDEIGKMDFAHRRDAFCGKFSVTDVFGQYQVPYTVMMPHVVHPLSKAFESNLRDFAAVCRVVNGMKRFTIGCIGARTTAFKTVRFDEITMQRHGINVECFDLSEVFEFVRQKDDQDPKVRQKRQTLENYTDFTAVPEDKRVMLSKIGVVIDEYIENYRLDAIALRCWNEMETYLRVCPCVLISELNDRGIAASCEIDMCSAVTMRALQLASEGPAACLDWNNNYGDDPDKVILFHCGSAAQKLMKEKGKVTSHKMFDKGDPGSGWGTNEGRIAAFPMTFSNCKTEDGRITIYFSEGEFTEDEIEAEYFGCAGVARIPDLQRKLIRLARGGFKHHTTVANGHMKWVLEEAFRYYLGYDVVSIEE